LALEGRSGGLLSTDQEAHVGHLDDGSVDHRHGAIKTHHGFGGELVHHSFAAAVEGAGGAHVSDVVRLRPDGLHGRWVTPEILVARRQKGVDGVLERAGQGRNAI